MEAYIPVISEQKVSVVSITTCPGIIRSPEQSITLGKHKTKNMRALYIQQSLLIHCSCIYDITASLSELAQKK